MRIFKKTFCIIFISSLCASAYSVDIVGNYKCSVYDPKKNSHYEEKLIIAKTGDTYRLQYYPIDSSISYILGTGILIENALANISWDPSSNWVGTSLFAVKEDGSLDGTWATLNTSLVGTETCNKT